VVREGGEQPQNERLSPEDYRPDRVGQMMIWEPSKKEEERKKRVAGGFTRK
jgi:hypothetical protein